MNQNFEHLVIGGLQRSGTSLLRAILGSHSEISIYQWDLVLLTKFSKIYSDKVLNTNTRKELISDVINHSKQKAADTNLHENDFKHLINLESSSPDFFFEFYSNFLSLYLKKTKGSYVGLKTPENEFFAPIIYKNFPKTKFIQVIRNPLDIAVSLKRIKSDVWGGSVNYFSHIQKWKKSVERSKINSILYPNQYLTIKYEELISNPSEIVIKICKFLNVDFQEEMLNMKDHPGWKGSNSSFQNENKEYVFKTESINRYQDLLPEHIQSYYFYFLYENLKNFGYVSKQVKIPYIKVIHYNATCTINNIKERLMDIILRSKLYQPLKLIRRKYIRN